eukprot:6484342-Amphidinium_carterae.4
MRDKAILMFKSLMWKTGIPAQFPVIVFLSKARPALLRQIRFSGDLKIDKKLRMNCHGLLVADGVKPRPIDDHTVNGQNSTVGVANKLDHGRLDELISAFLGHPTLWVSSGLPFGSAASAYCLNAFGRMLEICHGRDVGDLRRGWQRP